MHSATLKNAAESGAGLTFDSALRSAARGTSMSRRLHAPASTVKSVGEWISNIKLLCSEENTRTIELARLLYLAKRELPYGQWTQMWKSGGIPFSKRKGEMLVVIGKNLGCLDAQNSAHLPSGWNTLYYLARLDRSVLENLILDGIVHPALTLKEAKALLAKFKGKGTERKSTLRQRFKMFRDYVQAQLDDLTAEDRNWARCELYRLADQLAKSGNPPASTCE